MKIKCNITFSSDFLLFFVKDLIFNQMELAKNPSFARTTKKGEKGGSLFLDSIFDGILE